VRSSDEGDDDRSGSIGDALADAFSDAPSDDSTPVKSDGVIARGKAVVDWGARTLGELRERVAVVDLGVRVYERDKEAAGTLLGSALSLRLFLFYVPLVLTAVGIAGLLGRFAGVDSISSSVGVSGSLAAEIDAVFDQRKTAPWIAIALGLYGMAWTGRSLAQALVLSSALSWQLGGRQRLRVRAIGIVVGLVVGMALTATIVNRLRASVGLAVASVSYAAVAGVYVILWLLLIVALPRRTPDPGAALPGAAIMAAVMTVLQMALQLYLPHKIESASSLYGRVGVVVALLGWFYIIGRSIAFSLAVNAVLYERLGSLSGFVFALPGLRILPRRVPAVRRFFDLDQPSSDDPPAPE
jgi:uncharacterized BrkB/YihY/UPF0761 family membrane protein